VLLIACAASALAQTAPLAARSVDFSNADAIRTPTMGMRSRAAAAMALGAGEVAEATAECILGLNGARLTSCAIADESLPAERRAALALLASRYEFQNPFEAELVRARFSVSASYADLDPISFEEAPTVTSTAGMMERRPSGVSIVRAYPRRALERAAEANTELICRVEPDQSLACAARVLGREDDPFEAEFVEAALDVSHDFQALPAFADGRTTTGERLRMVVAFRLAN